MALTAHYGLPLRGPSVMDFSRYGYNSADAVTIDASTEKIALMGWVWWPGFATKSIRKVIFRTGTCSVNASSVVRVSLQDIDSATGTPPQPDGTQDQYADVAGTAVTSNTTITTGNLTADRSVAWGAGPLCVVIEYQTFTSTNTMNVVCTRRAPPSGNNTHLPCVSLYTGTWGANPLVPNILFEADDGTIGCFFQCPMIIDSQPYTYANTHNEVGLKFRVAYPTSLCGAQVFHGANVDGRDFQLRLYAADGTTVLASKDYLGEWTNSNNPNISDIPFSLTDLTADTDYYLTLADTTGGFKNLQYVDVASASHLTPWLGASKACWVERASVGTGSFTEVTTRLPAITPYLGKFDSRSSGAYQLGIV